jgi:hypothetical protein
MRFTVPGMILTALIVASPAALAQNMNTGNASTPGASVAKDNTTSNSKKHMASHKKQHQAKTTNSNAMKSKAQTTGSGSNPAKPEKDDTTPKSR